MIKKLKIVLYVIILLFLPFFIVLMSSCNIRYTFGRTIIYNSKCNTTCNYINSENVGTKTRFAKVEKNCYLFKSSDIADASYRNIFYIIPESYFVIILSDVSSIIFKVQYDNNIGYVSKECVKEVDFTPVNRFLSGVKINMSETSGTHLRSSPTTEDSNNIISIIPAGTKLISYIASTNGSVPTGGNSNVWYYVLYCPVSDPTSIYEGYIYSSKVSSISEIIRNEEGDEILEQDKKSDDYSTFSINGTVKVILILVICLPILLVFILLVSGNKVKSNKKENLEVKNNNSISENFTSNIADYSSSKKFKKVKDFNNQIFMKKKPFFVKFFEDDSKNDNNSVSVPQFPSYEIIDDDDLL